MKFRLLFAMYGLSLSALAYAAESTGIIEDDMDSGVSLPVPDIGKPAAPDIGKPETAVADAAIQNTEQKKPLRYLLGAGLTMGGDKLGTITYPDGSTSNVTAGRGIMLYGGLDYRLNHGISLQGTVGYHFDSTNQFYSNQRSANGELKFGRSMVELIAYYQISDIFRFGAGLRSVTGPKLKGSGTESATYTLYDNTVGKIIEGEYMFNQSIGIRVRHVNETYHPAGNPVSIAGSHFGVLANFYF